MGPFDVGPIGFFDSAVIGNVLALRVDSVDVEFEFGERVIAVLVNDALGPVQILFLGLGFPPISQIAIGSELATLVVESVCYFVSDDPSDGRVIQIGRTIFAEEGSLQDASGKFWKNKQLETVVIER